VPRSAAALILAALTLGSAALAGCATGVGPEGPGEAQPGGVLPGVEAAGSGADPVGLVGLWRVSAEGAGERTWLRLADGGYQLWQHECRGYSEGSWRASARVFVAAAPFLASAGCPLGPWPDGEHWLTSARAYRAAGDGWELLDAEGEVVARLTVDGAPDPIATGPREYASPPDVTDAVREAFAEPPALPEGLRPATADDLVGRWVPTGGRRARGAHVEVLPDGTYTGSDGCNAATGAWAADVDGRVLATAGIRTTIFCDGVDVPSMLASAARAGFDGALLVLVDDQGEEIGRLVRD